MPSSFLLGDHDNMRRIGVGTREYNTRLEKLLHDFLDLILLGKGMTIREHIGRNIARKKGSGMIMNTMRRRKSLRSGKTSLVFGEDRLEVGMHGWCLNFLNGMELGNNSLMTFS